MKVIPKVHYITQDLEGFSHPDLVLEACKAGLDLIQLRLKHQKKADVLAIARESKAICDEFNAGLIINDHLDIAFKVGALGVHLGRADTSHRAAREQLGSAKIIGGTAYNREEAMQLMKEGIVDYIGLGTFRKTKTKPEITQFLVPGEITSLITELNEKSFMRIPVLIIGGVQISDIKTLLSTGAHGIAIASLVNHAEDKKDVVENINKEFSEWGVENLSI